MLPKGILFDLDDTIISMRDSSDYAWIEVCIEFAQRTSMFNSDSLLNEIIKIRKWYWSDEYRHKAGRLKAVETRKYIIGLACKNLKLIDYSLPEEIADTYSKLFIDKIDYFPDAEKTLKYLNDVNVPLVLVTNGESDMQREKIEKLEIEKYFKTILVEGEMDFGKPDERIYIRALEELGLKEDEVWMVGDNLVWDIEAPQKLGIYSIWNDFKRTGLLESSKIIPDRIIHNISEFIE